MVQRFSERLVSSRADISTDEIEVRHCDNLNEYQECVKLQIQLWGNDLTVPSAMFAVAHHTGGQVLGAFDGRQLVGFTLAVVGERGGSTFIHSHMTGVVPEYQNKGVGRRLKLFQRQDALKRGFKLVEWTFDPLELKNAHFNLVRLGAVVRRFIPNCYGITESPLHAAMPTDRLVAEWWIDSDRVKNILADDPPPANHPFCTVPVPTDIGNTRRVDKLAAIELQREIRGQFEKLLHGGYVATGLERRSVTTDYVLEPAASIAGLRLPPYRPEQFED
jgi:predicted GNAT superfamily acetyltransferase